MTLFLYNIQSWYYNIDVVVIDHDVIKFSGRVSNYHIAPRIGQWALHCYIRSEFCFDVFPNDHVVKQSAAKIFTIWLCFSCHLSERKQKVKSDFLSNFNNKDGFKFYGEKIANWEKESSESAWTIKLLLFLALQFVIETIKQRGIFGLNSARTFWHTP